MEPKPHYTKVEELPLLINVVTGRSMFYGARPWRCTDRFYDFFIGFMHFAPVTQQLSLWRLARKCAQSEVGEEPQDDYAYLNGEDVQFYVDRYRAGMMRNNLFERYPYNIVAVMGVLEADAERMRLWRAQRQAEAEAKAAVIDDVLHSSVLSKRRPPS